MNFNKNLTQSELFDESSTLYLILLCSPGGSDTKESACHVGDLGAIPGLERSPGKGNGYSLQYSCLQNSMDTEEPGGLLLSTGSQRVGYDGMTNTSCIFRLCI